MTPSTVRQFLETKIRALTARTRRLAALTPNSVGLRPQDMPYAPSPDHFRAANNRLGEIDRAVRKRLTFLQKHRASGTPQLVLLYIAFVEREIDRARRAFGMFFEVFSQRGSVFAPALAAHDAIAADCYAAVRQSAPLLFRGPLLKPIAYMEHGYSPATTRRGVTLTRLLGERNPFPLIRIPWDRDNPWQAVFLHEVSHNLHADLGLWEETRQAVGRRVLSAIGDHMVGSVYSRWHKEIFADIAAVLLGGPASVWGMMDFLAHPPPRVLTYKPGGAHPTGYLRVLIMAEMLRRMGFDTDEAGIRKVWANLYRPRQGHRIPVRLLQTSSRIIPHVVDEIAFQTKRSLAQRALVDVVSFTKEDEDRIHRATGYLLRGIVPKSLPPRFLVSASHYALKKGATPLVLSKDVIKHLSSMAARPAAGREPARLAVA
jgi:hypothetical protein